MGVACASVVEIAVPLRRLRVVNAPNRQYSHSMDRDSRLFLAIGIGPRQISQRANWMTLTDVIRWLTTPEITAVANAATMVALALAVYPLVVFMLKRLRKRETLPHIPTSIPAQSWTSPRTWWEYLTNDLELSPKARKVCASLYNIGWEQLNTPTNNRDEIIEDAEADLRRIRSSLSPEEVAMAEEFSVTLASSSDDGSSDVEFRLGKLSPAVQSSARLQATIRRTEHDKATDLALGIPLTEYREVKGALKEGTPPAHILDKLPLAWRMIRTINDPRPMRRALGNSVRPTRIRLTVHTESGIEHDDRAELDEDWVTSEKLDEFLLFTGIVPVYRQTEERKNPVLKDLRMVYVGQDPPGTKSRLWTRGGYVDRMLDRAARGEHPSQLRRESRRKRRLLVLNVVSLAFLVACIVFRIAVEFV